MTAGIAQRPFGDVKPLGRAPEAYVSLVTPWEVAIKVAGGKLRLTRPPGGSWDYSSGMT